jgi:hypothetical protein
MKILIAAGFMGMVCLAVTHIAHSRMVQVLLGIPSGAVVYYVVASALKVPELREARDLALRRLRGGKAAVC